MARPLETIRRLDANHVAAGRRRMIYFGGCDYHRLAWHPQVIAAAVHTLQREGLNVGASRRTTGNHPLYLQLEAELARFFDAPAATLVATGYAGAAVTIQALKGQFDRVLIDERSHPALMDAAAMSGAPVTRFAHRNPTVAAQAAKQSRRGAKILLLTDGLFAHDGTVAPLREYLRRLPRGSTLLVDDAHGAGVLGAHGRGSLEQEAVSRRHVIQTITLSKAFGSFGGAVLGSRALREQILERSGAWVGSTPPPLPAAAAALEGVKLLRRHRSRLQISRTHACWVRAQLRAMGIAAPDHPGPIVAWLPPTPGQARRLARNLERQGILPPFLNYPGGPSGGCFRFVISSGHTRAQLKRLIAAFQQLAG